MRVQGPSSCNALRMGRGTPKYWVNVSSMSFHVPLPSQTPSTGQTEASWRSPTAHEPGSVPVHGNSDKGQERKGVSQTHCPAWGAPLINTSCIFCLKGKVRVRFTQSVGTFSPQVLPEACVSLYQEAIHRGIVLATPPLLCACVCVCVRAHTHTHTHTLAYFPQSRLHSSMEPTPPLPHLVRILLWWKSETGPHLLAFWTDCPLYP